MAMSKPCFFTHLKTLAKPHHIRHQQQYPPYFVSLGLLSFATPEDAAAEGKRSKRRLCNHQTHYVNLNLNRLHCTLVIPFIPTVDLLCLLVIQLRLFLFDNPNMPIFSSSSAGVIPNVVTYNLLINKLPLARSPRVLVKGLVDNSKIEQALPVKDDMIEKGLQPISAVYNYLILFEELRRKFGEPVSDGIVYGKGMEKEAVDCYSKAVGENSSIRMSVVAYNSILDALNQNGRCGKALDLFNKTFNVMVDGFQKKFKDAIEVFRNMGEKRCNPDTVLFNNLIEQLCGNSMVAEAEELYNEMGEKGINLDEVTYVLLMDACFSKNRADVANGYFGKMLESGFRRNLVVFSKVTDGLIEAGKIDKAKLLDPGVSCFESMLKTLCEARKLDEVLKTIDGMLSDESLGLSSEMKEYASDDRGKK
ncbi:hypothetical protein MKW98_009573 [Papaver atlanticum]|uniref:Pentatricopeptide repeat-containing protein n=1 Tax=Papaver atlanticum TaxID=357466 RepID=A0AAD4SDI9_9MAGN|nr:hypothetical protein MKW98_009573 [Papaver atlanticum]